MDLPGLASAAFSVIGSGLGLVAWGQARGDVVDRRLALVLALVLGLGIWSLGHAVLLLFGEVDRTWVLGKDLALGGVGAALAWRLRASFAGTRIQKPPRLLAIAFLALSALAVTIFVVTTMKEPDGAWDAVMIWNLHARFQYLGGAEWTSALETLRSHPDYPLLLPGIVSQAWQLFGGAAWVPAAVAGVFAALCVLLLRECTAELADPTRGWLAACVLVATPWLASQAAMQMADMPLATFSLAGASLAALACRPPRPSSRFLVLSGVAMSLAAWTKNEGLAHLCALAAVLLFVGNAPRASRLQRTAAFLGGALPGLLVLGWFKLGYAPANDLVSESTPAGLARNLCDPERYVTIALAWFESLLRVRTWGIGWLLIGVALAVVPRPWPPGARLVGAFGLVLHLGFALVYVLTPKELGWHLQTSLDRLLLQTYPLLLLACGASLPRPWARATVSEATLARGMG